MLRKCLLSLSLILMFINISISQERYLEEKFSQVSVSTITYGTNYSVLTGVPVITNLQADVYTPDNDTEDNRPLIIYFHSGNFLPVSVNQSVSGTRTDSTVVTMCTRLAKMGYVVVSASYRLGWNPASTDIDVRKSTLINAAYRGVQDARSAIRYFKLNADTYKIDENKIVIWGQGTGGYLSLNTGALDKYTEVINTTNPPDKFYAANGAPMVVEPIHGNVDGTAYGVHPQSGDTLSKPNNVGPTSDVQLVVNMGGALGDISWIDDKTPPIISFHTINDPFAPYKDAILFVPGAQPQPVVQVQGAYVIQKKMTELGLNDAFAKYDFIDDLSDYAESINEGNAGLFPLFKTEDNKNDSSPWDFWDKATNPNNPAGLFFNPDMSKQKAVAYMDTIINYVAPRACLVLNLDCNLSGIVSTKTISAEKAGITAMPNPANDFVTIKSEVKTINSIVLYDASGRAVKTYPNVNSDRFNLQRNNLPPGVYYAQVRFENESASVKLIFN